MSPAGALATLPEVLVVGAGPAGLASAIALRLRGRSVCVVDRRPAGPLDKACGEGLMPAALQELRALGVRLESGRPFRGICYVDGPVRASAELPSPGLGLRRLELHQALVDRAAELGVALCFGVRVEGIESAASGWRVQVGGESLAPRWLIGADGLRSPLRRAAGLERPTRRLSRFGVRRHLRVAPWNDCVEVHWGPIGEAYVTPVAEDSVGVAMLWSGAKCGFERLLDGFPELHRRLRGVPVSSRDQGAGPFEQRVACPYRENLILVGDASGYLDPITGEGLALGLTQSRLLAEALEGGELERYAAQHRRLARLPDLLTRATLLLSCRPRLRARVLGVLARDPELFRRLLAVHSGTAPLSSVGLPAALRLARCLAW